MIKAKRFWDMRKEYLPTIYFASLGLLSAVVCAQLQANTNAVPMPKSKPAEISSMSASSARSIDAAGSDQATGQSASRIGRYVLDEAGILSDETEFKLTKALAKFRAKQGIQVLVYAIGSLQGLDMKQFEKAVAQQWGIAHTKDKPSALMLVAPNEGAISLKVAPGLEEWMSPDMADYIIRSFMIPAFQQKDWNRGIIRGTAGVLAVFGRETPFTMKDLALAYDSQSGSQAIKAQSQLAVGTSSTPESVAASQATPSQSALALASQANTSVWSWSSLFLPIALLALALSALTIIWWRGRDMVLMEPKS